MRTRSINYFLGSLFSRQAIFAYGIAGSITTAGQLLLVSIGVFSGIPQQTEAIPVVIELYIETLIPLWVSPVTPWNLFVLLVNIIIGLWIVLLWTLNYESSL